MYTFTAKTDNRVIEVNLLYYENDSIELQLNMDTKRLNGDEQKMLYGEYRKILESCKLETINK